MLTMRKRPSLQTKSQCLMAPKAHSEKTVLLFETVQELVSRLAKLSGMIMYKVVNRSLIILSNTVSLSRISIIYQRRQQKRQKLLRAIVIQIVIQQPSCEISLLAQRILVKSANLVSSGYMFSFWGINYELGLSIQACGCLTWYLWQSEHGSVELVFFKMRNTSMW